jgi:3-dehydroquinate synthetase/predicted NBD/HSP70 family sugar kinase
MLNGFSSTALTSAAQELCLSRSVVTHRDSHFEVQLLPSLHLGDLLPLLKQLAARSGLLVTTPTVARLYGEALTHHLDEHELHFPLLVLNCTEHTKSLAQVEHICRQAYRHGLDRKAVLIALGGGVCSDLVTMAASWIRRGIATIRLPTTLIGQVDAAIGIKGAVNFQGKKNALGCFYPPEAVLIDPTFLHSLPERYLRAGFAEILKMALIRDAQLFALSERIGPELIVTRFASETPVKEALLWLAITRMLEELEPNFYEDRSYQRLVDFGHVFSPLIEARSGYVISHGEAVAIDMAYSCTLSHRLGLLSGGELARILASFQALGLPCASPLLDEELVMRALSESVAHRGGKVNLVLPTGIGSTLCITEQECLESADLRAALTDLSEAGWYSPHTWLSAPTATAAQRTAQKSCLVFDIGGTHLRCGLYEPATRTLHALTHYQTPSHWSLPDASRTQIYKLLLEAMRDIAAEVSPSSLPQQVCVAFPGPIDLHGRVVTAPTVWGGAPEQPIDMAADLHRFWPEAQIHLLNDVVASGYRYVERQGQDSFCIVTVSSGIGNKIFIDGKPHLGPTGRGGEIGHMRVDYRPNALPCDCGGRGHLGGIASGRGTLSYVRRLAAARPEAFRASILSELAPDPGTITNTHIAAAFHRRDAFVLQSIRETAQPLAAVLAGIHTALGLERFILVGGFAMALSEPYRRELVELTSSSSWSIGQDWEHMIQLGYPDDLSGLIGAGRYICEFVLQSEQPPCV